MKKLSAVNLIHKKGSFLLGEIFYCIKDMNWAFVVISTLVKSSIGEKCLINFLMNVSAKALRDYLECANIYKGTSPKKKTDLIEKIIYGCITEKLDKKEIEDISIKQAIKQDISIKIKY